jgi:chromosome partitioning protein
MTDEFSDQRPRRRLFGRRRPDEDLTDPAPNATSPAAPPDRPGPATDPALEPGSDPAPVGDAAGSPQPPARPEPPHPQAEPAAERPLPEPEPEPAPPVPAPPPPVPDPRPAPHPEPEPAPAPRPEPIRAVAEPPAAPSAAEPPVTSPPPPPAPPAEPLSGPDGAARPAPGDDGEPVPLEIPRIIAIANQKGGVGKTTTAVNLGAALAESGLRVLVVDLDPQGNASTGLGINPRDVGASIYDVLMQDTPALDAVEPTSLKNLFVIPATLDLAGAEIELVPAFSRELKLKRALDAVRSEYDVVLIDCPPSLGLLTVNGLAAADDVIVPIQCEYYALEGLGQLLRNVALVRSSLNASLDVRGIILTMYDARTRLAEQVETEVREHFGTKVYKTVVPRTVRLAEAPSFGQPVIVFDSTSRGATAYRNLAKEVSGGATRRTG